MIATCKYIIKEHKCICISVLQSYLFELIFAVLFATSSYALQSSERATTASSEEHMVNK